MITLILRQFYKTGQTRVWNFHNGISQPGGETHKAVFLFFTQADYLVNTSVLNERMYIVLLDNHRL
ncbi:MAG: hypothetical protein BWZ06_01722 [Bacteroidetes bacterium ADurb.BinA261]|nr:MAG: hypothetical protein BWZ06_01722 [Bacteroidetes bacterium ADurb.BinA261]